MPPWDGWRWLNTLTTRRRPQAILHHAAATVLGDRPARPDDVRLSPAPGGRDAGTPHLNARPDPVLRTMAPDREDLVVAVAGLFPWDWRADRWAQAGMPVVRGQALDLTALPGGHATPDTMDAQQSAVRRRGGLRPPADVYPAARRATRERLRRRRHVMRHRAALLSHGQHPTSQDTRPAMGRQLADQTHRAGVAARGAEPAGPTSLAVDLALLGPDDARRRDVARSLLHAAQPHDANTRSRLRTVPGSGEMLSLGRRSELHDRPRFPRGQAVVSSGRRVTGAHASAGQRDGTAGTTSGTAALTGAVSEAAVRFLRATPAGQNSLGRREQPHGQGPAWTVWAHTRARAVYALLTRDPAFARHTCLTSSRERRGRAWRLPGHCREQPGTKALAGLRPCVRARGCACRLDLPAPLALMGRSRRRCCRRRGHLRMTGAAPPPHLARTGARDPVSRVIAADGMRAPRGFSTAEAAPAVSLHAPSRRRARLQTGVVPPRAGCACRWPCSQRTPRDADDAGTHGAAKPPALRSEGACVS
jgi:hypothetical protein